MIVTKQLVVAKLIPINLRKQVQYRQLQAFCSEPVRTFCLASRVASMPARYQSVNVTTAPTWPISLRKGKFEAKLADCLRAVLVPPGAYRWRGSQRQTGISEQMRDFRYCSAKHGKGH